MTPFISPTANPVFFRTYSRRFNEQRESWDEVCDRTVKALIKLGCLTRGEAELVMRMQEDLKTFPSGRWLWVGGTKWLESPENFYGSYNCSSLRVTDWRAFRLLMDLAMMGTGTGAMLENRFIDYLPTITTHLDVKVIGTIGSVDPDKRKETTEFRIKGELEDIHAVITVGDSRKGWVDSYHKLLELSSSDYGVKRLRVLVDVSNVRPSGEPLKGFGGTSNPSMLEGLYTKIAKVLNKAVGRKLTAVECCLIIDEAALVIVSGNIRRCLAYGSMVSTDKGRKAIQDIQIGDMVLTTKGYYPVTDKFEQGVQSVCRIITSGSQNSLRCTERHQVAVLNGGTYKMVPAGNLQRGDLLVRVSPNGAVAPDRILSVEWNADKVETFDIEVAEVHEFVCGGLLVHNSAGMKQGSSNDEEFANAKLNLWQQDDAGNWRIDPERDALRMSNHTRVYHTKPSLEKCIDAVRQQYYSGEGAIQWAGEAVARANADLFPERSQQIKFIKAYEEGRGEAYLRKVSPGMSERELKHRMERWGLNPCLTADTWIHTEQGPRQIKDLIGKQQNLYVNGKLFPTTPEGFFYSGDKQVFKLETVEGYSVRMTDNHKLFKFDEGLCWWTEVKDLKPGDKVKIHNHYGATWSKWDKDKLHKDPNDSKDLEKCSFDFYLDYLRRRFHHLGDVVGGAVGMTLSDPSDAISIQRMLLRLGITSKIDKSSLTVSSDSLSAFTKLIGFSKLGPAGDRQTRLEEAVKYADYLDGFTVTVKSITPDGIEPVYDCQVPGVNCFDANGFMSHNCGEIIGADFLCVSGDTLLITKDGLHKIKDLSGTVAEIWNGKRWSKVSPFKTGSNRTLYRVNFRDGSYLDATENHRFFVKDRFAKSYKEVETKDLMDVSKYSIHTEPFKIKYEGGLNVDTSYAYTLGAAVGDGNINKRGKPIIRLYCKKMELELQGTKSPLMDYDYSPQFKIMSNLDFSADLVTALKHNPNALNVIASWSKQAILYFMAGMADTDGSNTEGHGIRIYISDYDRAYRCQLLLAKCGIRCSVNLCAKKGAITNKGTRSKDLYYLQITDCGDLPCQRLDVSKGRPAKHKGKWQVVESVVQLPGKHDTYCFNEPEFHKGVFGNTLAGNCNLSEVHLNNIDPFDFKAQEDAFKAGGVMVASLLHHKFPEERLAYSRELDPIVGVGFTGLFDFFVNAFGVDWLRWWEAERPKFYELGFISTQIGVICDWLNVDFDEYEVVNETGWNFGTLFKDLEKAYLCYWRSIVQETVWEYCDRHGLKRPNRFTDVQPSGTKALLTGASPGWHPAKAQRFIRRITFGKNDPVALACIDYGYSVIPSQSDKDENGNLLNDPFDPRCTEWLVEIPVAVNWADLPGADEIDISQFSALAQMDFYLNVQSHYVTHNTSATVEVRESEIETLGTRIYDAIQNDEGYISAALLARFDDKQTYPRLPFEPIDKATYDRLSAEVLERRVTDDFQAALSKYDKGEDGQAGPAGCDSDKCLLPLKKPE